MANRSRMVLTTGEESNQKPQKKLTCRGQIDSHGGSLEPKMMKVESKNLLKIEVGGFSNGLSSRG